MKKIILPCITIALLIVLLSVNIIYAWFIEGNIIDGPLITAGEVKLSEDDVRLFVGNDIELDDTLDLDENGKYYTEIEKEIGYSFTGTQMLVPSKKLSYRLIIDNTSEFTLDVGGTFTGVTGMYLISLFSIENVRYLEADIDKTLDADSYIQSESSMENLTTPTYLPDLIEEDTNNYIYTNVKKNSFLEDETNKISVSSNKRIVIDFNLCCMTLSDINRNKEVYGYSNGELLNRLEDFFNNVNQQVYGLGTSGDSSQTQANNIFRINSIVVSLKTQDVSDDFASTTETN